MDEQIACAMVTELETDIREKFANEWQLIKNVILNEHKPNRLKTLLSGTNTKYVLDKLIAHPLVRDAHVNHTPIPLATRQWLCKHLDPEPVYVNPDPVRTYQTINIQNTQSAPRRHHFMFTVGIISLIFAAILVSYYAYK